MVDYRQNCTIKTPEVEEEMSERVAKDPSLSDLERLVNSPSLFDELPLPIRKNVWFLYDRALSHFTLNFRNHLRKHNAPANCPPRSPDLAPIGYF